MPTIHKYKEIFKVVLVYAIFGSGWIFFSDTLLNWLVRDPDIITQISIYKGLFFIIITSLLLFYLVARLSNKIRQSADALKESEERNRLLSDLTMEGIVIHKNGIAKHVNSSMAKMLGYEYGELLNKNFLEFIHDEDQNVVQQNIVKDYAEPYTIRVQRKGGQYFFAEIEARNFQARNDTWRVTAVRDITKRRWAEKKLTESHELLENLARLVPGVIYQYRLYPDGTSAFPYSSPGIFDIYGVTPKEVKEDATPVFGRLHPDDRERVTRTILESAETLNTFYCEFKVILPETGLGWRWSQAHPQKLEDGSILWHGIILDITERKNAEKAARRAKALTQQLLTFSKDGMPIRKITSLENLIRDSVEYALHGSTVASSFDIPEDLLLVDIDSGQIGQVIQNIVTNSRQAISGSGIINICCRNVESSEVQELPSQFSGKYIEIVVRDSGHGINQAVQSKIFDPYFTTKDHGSGLGLTIAHSIIQRHDGHIIVHSEEDNGTTFKVYLPAAVDQHLPKEKEKKRGKGKRFKIMVVDNEEMLLNIANRMLVHLGHECVCARSAREALDIYKHLWKTGSPVDGVIVSSGFSNDPVMVDFDEFGFCAAIAKPFDMDELGEVIEAVLD